MKTFTLPDLGEGLQEAEIVAWHVGVGDRVIADQPLVSVETAKAVVEVPSPWSGNIVALRAKAGDVVKIGGALVDIDPDGATQDSGTVVGTLPQSVHVSPIVRSVEPAGGVRVRVSPAVRRIAQERGIDPATITGYWTRRLDHAPGRGGRSRRICRRGGLRAATRRTPRDG